MSRPMRVQESPVCVRGDGVDPAIRVRCTQKALTLPELHSQEELEMAVFRPTVLSTLFFAVRRLPLAGLLSSG